jgi:hypothetical protein
MSDDSKIISLTDRARLRKGGRQAGKAAPPAEASPASAAKADRVKSSETAGTGAVPAQLVWLYCPACETLEYTELILPNGRIHQPCGTRVEEVTVDVDARAEYSLAELNLRQLERLAELVDGQRGRFREYQHRLELAAKQPLSSYPLTEETLRTMPVAQADHLGLLISAFLRQTLQRFRPGADPETREDGQGDTGEPIPAPIPPSGGEPVK